MPSRLSRPSNDEPSYDSFLDIVANLVGILVILVMVIGVRARGAFVDSRNETAAQPAIVSEPVVRQPLPNVEEAKSTVDSLTSAVHQINQAAKQTEALMAVRRQERDRLQVMRWRPQEYEIMVPTGQTDFIVVGNKTDWMNPDRGRLG